MEGKTQKFGDISTLFNLRAKPILGFFGEYRFLSNFHLHPVRWREWEFPSNENAYQFAKVREEDRELWVDKFLSATPSQAKGLGREVNIRPGWDDLRVEIMLEINMSKYLDPALRRRLFMTDGAYLEETNWWGDQFWGCHRGSREMVLQGIGLLPATGTNALGKILMVIRQGWKTGWRDYR